MEISTNNYKNVSSDYKDCYTFHKNEILPDYQKHMKIILAILQTIPDDSPKHIGMKKMRGRTTLQRYFIDFANKSTIHGLNHLVAPQRHPIERVLIALFIIGELICLIFVFCNLWHRYQNDATVHILYLNQQNLEIHKPALLICAKNKIDETKFSTTFQRYDVKDTVETRNFFRFLSNVDYETMHETPNFDAVKPEKWLRILYDLRYEFHLIFGNMQDTTSSWMITERGICLSMRNYVGVYATLEYWLADNWTVVPLPEIIPSYDYNNDDDSETITSITPIAVTVHDPGEIIEYRHKTIEMSSLMFGRYQFLILMVTAGWKVNELTVKQRNCKFTGDGGLKMWPVYTFKMCMMECRYQTIMQRCGCLPHFARPITGVPVCNAMQLRCIANIKNNLSLYNYVPDKCDCLPNCDGLHYSVEDYTISTLKSKTSLNTSVLNLFTRDPSIAIRQEKLFGSIDFLIAIGGAVGLFFGASVLSFVEIFYSMTLQLLLHFIKHRQPTVKTQ